MTRFAISALALCLLASCSDAAEVAPGPAHPKGPPAGPAAFALAFVEGGRAHVVLDASPDLAIATGAPDVRSLGDPVVAAREVATPGAGANAWLGRRVRLYGMTGAVCEGVVGAAALVGRVSPHEATLSRLRGVAEDEAPLAPSEVTDEAWRVVAEGGGVVLAGEVEGASCEGALFAGLADAPAPVFHPSAAADAETEARALAAFRALPAWAAVEARYEDEIKEDRAPMWDSHGEPRPTVNVVAAGGARLVVVTADVGGGCGDFGATQTTVFRDGARGLELVGAPIDASFVPTSAADVDGDGELDLVMPNGVRRAAGGAFERSETIEVPFLGCPC